MDLEDLEPRKKKPTPPDLDRLSVEELNEYVATLQAEMDRVKAKIASKTAYLAGAAALFKSG